MMQIRFVFAVVSLIMIMMGLLLGYTGPTPATAFEWRCVTHTTGCPPRPGYLGH